MSNSIGDVKGVTGSSMGLNGGKPGDSLTKPSASGNASPGGTKPDKPAEAPVKMPK